MHFDDLVSNRSDLTIDSWGTGCSPSLNLCDKLYVAYIALLFVSYQNLEWLVNHNLYRTAEPGRIARMRGFFWLVECCFGFLSALVSYRAHKRTSYQLATKLEAMKMPPTFAGPAMLGSSVGETPSLSTPTSMFMGGTARDKLASLTGNTLVSTAAEELKSVRGIHHFICLQCLMTVVCRFVLQ